MLIPDHDKADRPTFLSQIYRALLAVMLLFTGWFIGAISSFLMDSWREPFGVGSVLLDIWRESSIYVTIVFSIFGLFLCYTTSFVRPRDWKIHVVMFIAIPLWTIMKSLITTLPSLNIPLSIVIIAGIVGCYFGQKVKSTYIGK
jgi:uncharacterized BrkB/YihY/UPF0761 family membrane protein